MPILPAPRLLHANLLPAQPALEPPMCACCPTGYLALGTSLALPRPVINLRRHILPCHTRSACRHSQPHVCPLVNSPQPTVLPRFGERCPVTLLAAMLASCSCCSPDLNAGGFLRPMLAHSLGCVAWRVGYRTAGYSDSCCHKGLVTHKIRSITAFGGSSIQHAQHYSTQAGVGEPLSNRLGLAGGGRPSALQARCCLLHAGVPEHVLPKSPHMASVTVLISPGISFLHSAVCLVP
jgi:hypothetical protein